MGIVAEIGVGNTYSVLLATLCSFGLEEDLAILLLSRQHLGIEHEFNALLARDPLELFALQN